MLKLSLLIILSLNIYLYLCKSFDISCLSYSGYEHEYILSEIKYCRWDVCTLNGCDWFGKDCSYVTCTSDNGNLQNMLDTYAECAKRNYPKGKNVHCDACTSWNDVGNIHRCTGKKLGKSKTIP